MKDKTSTIKKQCLFGNSYDENFQSQKMTPFSVNGAFNLNTSRIMVLSLLGIIYSKIPRRKILHVLNSLHVIRF